MPRPPNSKEDRKEFEIFIGRRNKFWVAKDIFLELVIWEDFLDALSQTRLQDEYNKAARVCDIFVMLFWTKVGQYTSEEFETAFGQFKATSKPLIFTFFKQAEIVVDRTKEKDLASLFAFQKRLEALGHYQTIYENIDQLMLKFNEQLDKLPLTGTVVTEQFVTPPSVQSYKDFQLFISYPKSDFQPPTRAIKPEPPRTTGPKVSSPALVPPAAPDEEPRPLSKALDREATHAGTGWMEQFAEALLEWDLELCQKLMG